jgi:hypothetical protein
MDRRTAWQSVLSTLPALAVLVLARSAWACAVCYAAASDTRTTYYATTVLMSLAPLLLVGGLVWWIRRALRAQRPD